MAGSTAVLIHSQYGVGWGEVRNVLGRLKVTIVGEADTAETAIALVANHHPDLVLASSQLSTESSLETVAAIRRVHSPESRLIVFARELDREELVAFANLEPSAFVSWQDTRTVETLTCAMRLALNGEAVVVSRSIARAFDNVLRGMTDPGVPNVDLSDFERRLLAHRAKGWAYAEIAHLEGLTRRQVERDFEGLREKLNASDLFTLGVQAARLGLIPSS